MKFFDCSAFSLHLDDIMRIYGGESHACNSFMMILHGLVFWGIRFFEFKKTLENDFSKSPLRLTPLSLLRKPQNHTMKKSPEGEILYVSPFQGSKDGDSMATLHFVQGHEWFGSSGAT
jgi:hypothetical protein